jgi:benzodiazapine receptor
MVRRFISSWNYCIDYLFNQPGWQKKLKNMRGKKILPFFICLFIPLLVGSFSGFLTRYEVNGTWFHLLKKPFFNPPNWLFAPVWTSLYLLMGVSLFIVWNNSSGVLRKRAVFVFSLQFFLNFCWSILFFYFHMLSASVIDIILLWMCIFWLISEFKEIKPIAGYLQLPYLLWVSFASVLDYSIWLLNR